MYIIVNKANCSVLLRASRIPKTVYQDEVPTNERGEVSIVDVLTVMGYRIEGTYEDGRRAILPKTNAMTRERSYPIEDLELIAIDEETGVVS